ncbi:MAG: hypothetical protein HQL98_15035 [Magnetococcales bacterium]|nr:hypothetical protein [Magnetococcales bacterium]
MQTFLKYMRSAVLLSIIVLSASMASADPGLAVSNMTSDQSMAEPLVLAWNDRHERKCVRICRHRYQEALRDCESERRHHHCVQRAKRQHENCLNRCDY